MMKNGIWEKVKNVPNHQAVLPLLVTLTLSQKEDLAHGMCIALFEAKLFFTQGPWIFHDADVRGCW